MKQTLYITLASLLVLMVITSTPHAANLDSTPMPHCIFLPHIESGPAPEPYNVAAVDVVLHDEDLPGFTLDSAGSGMPPWMERMGAVDNYVVWYWNDAQSVPHTVYNTAIVFVDPSSALTYVRYAEWFCEEADGRIIPSSTVGDETVACAKPTAGGIVHIVTFRYGNIVSGLGIGAPLDTTMGFVKLSLARIERLTEKAAIEAKITEKKSVCEIAMGWTEYVPEEEQ